MARIPLVDPDRGGSDAKAGRVLSELGGGIHPNIYRAIANHPGALEAFAAFGKVIYFENTITPGQRELAYLTASATNRCHY